jgi:hypothetical protein
MLNYLISIIVVFISFITYLIYPHTETSSPVFGGSQLQTKISKKYKKYKLPKKRATFQEFCFPKSYKVQPQQEFLGEYMSPANQGKKPKTILVDHLIGAGKTCVAIQIAQRWTKYGKPLILLPASLIGGFYDEMRGNCSNEDYGKATNKDELALSNQEIDKDYNIMSFNKFLTSKRIKTPIIIIDEVQNVFNENGEYFKAIIEFINKNDDIPVVVMTGTPVFDNHTELTQIARLLRIESSKEELSVADVRSLFEGKVSFFAGAPSYTFPKTYINIVKCRMSKYQTRWYKSEVEAEKKSNKSNDIKLSKVNNNFYIKSRQRSNIVYPRGLGDEAAMTKSVALDHLETYSAKIYKMSKKLLKGHLSFIYTDFTGSYGISAIIKFLKFKGYKDYLKDGAGKKRFVIWSGDQTQAEKVRIRATFNSKDNDDASQIQIVIGSPAIKEGVSLMRVREVHIFNPYWNWSRLQQVYGRSSRFCSHKSLPAKDREVEIYIYCAVINEYKEADEITPDNSVDLYMLKIADEKKDAAEPYLEALMDVAIDKKLFQ